MINSWNLFNCIVGLIISSVLVLPEIDKSVFTELSEEQWDFLLTLSILGFILLLNGNEKSIGLKKTESLFQALCFFHFRIFDWVLQGNFAVVFSLPHLILVSFFCFRTREMSAIKITVVLFLFWEYIVSNYIEEITCFADAISKSRLFKEDNCF